MKSIRYVPFPLLLCFACAIGTVAAPSFAQTNLRANPCYVPGAPYDAANWSLVPQAARLDTLSAETRKAQDDWFSRFYPYNNIYVDPDVPNGSWTKESYAALPAYNPAEYWVVGTFLNYDVHEVPGKAIYTDLHIRVDRIADNHQDKPNGPVVGSVVDAGAMGGCLITPSGEVHGYLTEPGRARIQPGHRYLLRTWHSGINGLYEFDASIDLTSGKAVPLFAPDVRAAKAGTWPYLGLDEEAVIKRHRQDNPNN
jgi:hypothetical protein